MKKFLFLLALALGTTLSLPTAYAEEGSASSMGGMMINQGDLEVGGEGNFFRRNQGDYWKLNVSTKVEYFVLDRLSVGARVNFSDSNVDSTTVQAGPSGSFYFLTVGNVALYVDQAILWTNPPGDADNYIYGETGIGADFFVRPNVAVGPSVRGIYYFNGDTGLPPGGTDIRMTISTFF